MLYQITHTTTYTYDRPVAFSPHQVRLRPRCDPAQSLRAFSVEVNPTPLHVLETIDLDGNAVLKLEFSGGTAHSLEIQVTSEVETHRTNPFLYLLEPWATRLPIDYPASLLAQLQPYLGGQIAYTASHLDPVAIQLAEELLYDTAGNVVSLLSELNQRIYQTCGQTIRETGDPFPPGITWSKEMGSCRDLTVLFMEVCRAIGLGARFVSGYQEGDLNQSDRHLHAWAEVYLPGAGWRGYDPTQGLAVGDRHIALVASPSFRYAAPISGAIAGSSGAAQAEMQYHLSIQRVG